jgi:hypothetical protein
VSGSPNGDLYVWDAMFGHGRCLSLKVDAHDLGVTCCEFSPTFGTACKKIFFSILVFSINYDIFVFVRQSF